MRGRGLAALALLALSGTSTACDRAAAPAGSGAAAGGEAAGSETAAGTEALSGRELDALLAEGEAAHTAGNYERAEGVFRTVLERAAVEPDADPAAEVGALTSLALVAYQQGALEDAWDTGLEALARAEERGLDEHLFRAYNALGLIAWHQGRLDEATLRFEQALEAARAVDDLESQAKPPVNLGLIHQERGDLVRARASFTEALEAARAGGYENVEAFALNNLGGLHVWLDEDPLAAVELLERARALFGELEMPVPAINAIGQLGTAYAAMGRPDRAWAHFDSALALARELGIPQEEASNLELLGDLQAHLGDRRSALRSYDEAGGVYDAMGMLLDRGNILRKSAAVLGEAGDAEGARVRAEEALRLHAEVGASYEQLHDRLLLAVLAARRGAGDEALEQLDAAEELTAVVGVQAARAAVVLARARVMELLGDPEAVLSALRSEIGPPGSTTLQDAWALHALRAKAFAATGQVDSAVAAGGGAVAALEGVRGAIADGISRAAFVAARSDVYAEVAVALLRVGRPAEAWEVADAARGRALLDHLGTVRGRVADGTAVGDLAEAQQLLREIDQLARMLEEERSMPPDERSASGASREHELEQRLAGARERYEHRIRGEAWRSAEAAAAGLRPVRLADVQAVLRDDEVLLEYLVAEHEVVVFAVTRDDLHTVSSAIGREDLASRVRLALSLLERPDSEGEALAPVLEGLHALLAAPVERLPAARDRSRWIVVPHGVLAYLPFAALQDPETERVLVEDRVLGLLPGAGALPYQRGDPSAGSASAGSRLRAFAPLPDRLPATRREARELAAGLPGAGAVVGAGASEAAVREALEAGHVVHVASHGVLNAGNPLFSAVTLASPSRWTSSEDDGRLEVHEVLGLRVRSPLVFLSGCETARGSAWSTSFDAGEDYATLAQSFLYAGAGAVVATLWKIRDDSAAVFATRFHDHARRVDAAEALARAQRELLHDPRWAHPYYWAPYVVSGGG